MWGRYFGIVVFSLTILLVVSDRTSDIKNILNRVAGIYRDPIKAKQYPNYVLATASNFGFINHLHNFKCFIDRLNMKFMVFSMDILTHDYLGNGTGMESVLVEGGAGISGESSSFRTQQFNLITMRKKYAVLGLLKLGYNIIFSDTDVAIIRDPVPYLMWQGVDYVHSVNQGCLKEYHWQFNSTMEGNTGFYFVRSNNRTMKLWKDAIEAIPKYAGMDDQTVFWSHVIRQSVDPPIAPLKKCRHFSETEEERRNQIRLTTCALDCCVFASGSLMKNYNNYMTNLAYRNDTVVTVHANFIWGNGGKMGKMNQYGYWLAVKEKGKGWTNQCTELKR